MRLDEIIDIFYNLDGIIKSASYKNDKNLLGHEIDTIKMNTYDEWSEGKTTKNRTFEITLREDIDAARFLKNYKQETVFCRKAEGQKDEYLVLFSRKNDEPLLSIQGNKIKFNGSERFNASWDISRYLKKES